MSSVPPVPYNQPPPQIFQNREVFAHQPPVTMSFYQPPPQTQQFINQQCYQPQVGPPNYCNNPVYNHPVTYSNPPQCFPFNNQPVVYNTPPPSQGDYCQSYPMHPPPPPPPINYCSNTNNFERSVEQVNIQNREIVKTLYTGKPQKKRFTNKNFDASLLNKKKRVVESSNLHEIKPIETVPKPTVKPKEEATIKIVS